MIRVRAVKAFPNGPESAAFKLDVEFEAPAGVTVLYGASGSGKTLTLDCIAGFTSPDSGRILLNDRLLFDAEAGVDIAPQRRACGYVFQNQALFPHMTLRQNLAFAADSLPPLERHRRINDMMERFRLADLAGRHPHELSGGQKQRGSIARALIAEPGALLLDEPARGLDLSLREEFYEIIRDLRGSLQVPILLVTHNVDEIFALGDYVLVYEPGRIIRSGTPAAILRQPGSPAVAKLLGDFNILQAQVIALDPGRQTSKLLIREEEIAGPYLPGCFKGDQVQVCVRPEELRVATGRGPNRVRVNLQNSVERSQGIRAHFDGDLMVDVPRASWLELKDHAPREGWWVEIPAAALRKL